jgi:hypothetical protein
MTMPPDPAQWGFAAILFSLDLAEDLARLALPALDWPTLRLALRDAILRNRQYVDAGHAPLHLKQALAAELHARQAPEMSAFVDFVERQLVTPIFPANGQSIWLMPLHRADILADIDATAGFPGPLGKSWPVALHQSVDAAAAEVLFDAVVTADSRIDSHRLSGWDHAIIARNAETHPPENPMATLIHSLRLRLLTSAAERIASQLPPDQRARLADLCRRKAMA